MVKKYKEISLSVLVNILINDFQIIHKFLPQIVSTFSLQIQKKSLENSD